MHIRRCNGSVIADYTAAIVVFVLLLMFPFINYVTIGLRYFLLRDICHTAAITGSQCTTFQAGTNSVMNRVPAVVNQEVQKYPGISIQNLQIRIIQTSLDQVKRFGSWDTRWASPTDAVNNVYTIEVAITADLEPLIPWSNGPFQNAIPGLTGPAHITYASQQMSENPSGLNQ